MINDGQTVKVHYEGRLVDGTLFDSSEGKDPLSFVMGSGEVIPGFECALRGRSVGEEFTVTIPAAEAYGDHKSSLVFEAPRGEIPPDLDVKVGQVLRVATNTGARDMLVLELTDEHVLLDANHPLAGADLTFTIKVVDVQ